MCRLEFLVDVDVVIASSGKARKQGGSSKTFVQVRPDFCNSGVEYRYPISGIGTQIQHWNLVLASEYRYQLPENSFWNSLKLDFLHLGPYVCHV
ncbi:hypothetical protein GQ457_11G024870 [Hibiscus cannabinus]